jgi:hypothetical protein
MLGRRALPDGRLAALGAAPPFLRWVLAVAGFAVFAFLTAGCSQTHTAGFWFADDALTLPDAVAGPLGGPLTDRERASLQQIARAEIDRAFAGLPLSITEGRDAFWRVAVLRSLPSRGNRALPHAGESLAMGFMGGTGAVDFDFVAFTALHVAHDPTARPVIVEAMGRGIGRVAVHEFMHQILGASIGHDDSDANSYEFGNPERRSQYYGELHWTTALPLLRLKLGSR